MDTSTLTIDQLPVGIPVESRRIVSELHGVLTERHGCAYRIDLGKNDGACSVAYSGMGVVVGVDSDAVSLHTEYDIRAVLSFYRNDADETARELVFNAAIPCCFCIDDKCTTLLTDRTISFGGQTKQLCGPYRHQLDIPVTEPTIEAVKSIIDMAFRFCTQEMHQDVLHPNEVTYRTEALDEFYVVGYRHRSTMLSVRTEDFIAGCFERGEGGRSRLDTLAELVGAGGDRGYVGVTKDFVDGLCYTFILGVPCSGASIPAQLPDGVEAVRVGAGDYAVYNSSTGDYPSVWRHFKDQYYDLERKGYDTSRTFFEHFDASGRFHDVSIPVSAGSPKGNGMRFRVVKRPDFQVAGFYSYAETDFPLNRDVPDEWGKLHKLFPSAERYLGIAIHAKPGQPISHMAGVEIDRFDDVPDGLDVRTVRGGHWHSVSYPYPVPGDYWFDKMYEPGPALDTCQHPRAFIEYNCNGRGAYSEIVVPVRIVGERVVELVERPVWRLVGKEARLPVQAISDADVDAFRALEANLRKGSCITTFRFEPRGGTYYFAGPVIKGAEVEDTGVAPDGMGAFTIEGGQYARITEAIPNGELDWWTPWYALTQMQAEIGYEIDLSRRFFVDESGYGREFAFYVPVK